MWLIYYQVFLCSVAGGVLGLFCYIGWLSYLEVLAEEEAERENNQDED